MLRDPAQLGQTHPDEFTLGLCFALNQNVPFEVPKEMRKEKKADITCSVGEDILLLPATQDLLADTSLSGVTWAGRRCPDKSQTQGGCLSQIA